MRRSAVRRRRAGRRRPPPAALRPRPSRAATPRGARGAPSPSRRRTTSPTGGAAASASGRPAPQSHAQGESCSPSSSRSRRCVRLAVAGANAAEVAESGGSCTQARAAGGFHSEAQPKSTAPARSRREVRRRKRAQLPPRLGARAAAVDALVRRCSCSTSPPTRSATSSSGCPTPRHRRRAGARRPSTRCYMQRRADALPLLSGRDDRSPRARWAEAAPAGAHDRRANFHRTSSATPARCTPGAAMAKEARRRHNRADRRRRAQGADAPPRGDRRPARLPRPPLHRDGCEPRALRRPRWQRGAGAPSR